MQPQANPLSPVATAKVRPRNPNHRNHAATVAAAKMEESATMDRAAWTRPKPHQCAFRSLDLGDCPKKESFSLSKTRLVQRATNKLRVPIRAELAGLLVDPFRHFVRETFRCRGNRQRRPGPGRRVLRERWRGGPARTGLRQHRGQGVLQQALEP